MKEVFRNLTIINKVNLNILLNYFKKKVNHFKFLELDIIFYNILIIIISLIQTILITKFLSQKDYGVYGFYVSLSQYILVLTNWGFSSWGVNEISKNFAKKDEIISKIFYSRLISGGVAFFIIAMYFCFFMTSYNFLVFFGFFIYYLSLAVSPEILYISRNRIKEYILINLKAKFIYTISLILFIFSFNLNPSFLFFLFAIQNLLITFFSSYINEKVVLHPSVFEIKNVIITLRNSISNFFLIFVSFLFASGPVILSGLFMDKNKFSVVYASVAIIKIVQAAYTPMIQKILPKLNIANINENQKDIIKYDLLLCIIYSLTTIFFILILAPIIVKVVFNEKYVGLVEAIRFYSFSILPGLLSTIILSQFSVFLNIIKKSYLIVLFSSLFIFLFLIYNLYDLTWNIVLRSMIFGEYFQFILLSLLVLRKIRKQN